MGKQNWAGTEKTSKEDCFFIENVQLNRFNEFLSTEGILCQVLSIRGYADMEDESGCTNKSASA